MTSVVALSNCKTRNDPDLHFYYYSLDLVPPFHLDGRYLCSDRCGCFGKGRDSMMIYKVCDFEHSDCDCDCISVCVPRLPTALESHLY